MRRISLEARVHIASARALNDELEVQIEETLQKGYELYKQRGWI
jgi:hypothetical protein